MSRLADTILKDGIAYANGSRAPMVNLNKGGLYGWAPDNREWLSNQNYMSTNIIPIMLEAPKVFSLPGFPDSDVWISGIRNLMETQPTRIEGLKSELTVETVQQPMGGGDVLETPSDVKRPNTELANTYRVKYGRPEQHLLEHWINIGIKHPITKVPGIATILDVDPKDMLADLYTATMLYIRPDPLHKYVDHAWLVTNVFPKSTGAIDGIRAVTEAATPLDITIAFSGFATVGDGVNIVAQTHLDNINLINADPDKQPAFVTDVESDVAATKTGYKESVNASRT